MWLNWNAKLIHKRPAMCEAELYCMCNVSWLLFQLLYMERSSVWGIYPCAILLKKKGNLHLYIFYRKLKWDLMTFTCISSYSHVSVILWGLMSKTLQRFHSKKCVEYIKAWFALIRTCAHFFFFLFFQF